MIKPAMALLRPLLPPFLCNLLPGTSCSHSQGLGLSFHFPAQNLFLRSSYLLRSCTGSFGSCLLLMLFDPLSLQEGPPLVFRLLGKAFRLLGKAFGLALSHAGADTNSCSSRGAGRSRGCGLLLFFDFCQRLAQSVLDYGARPIPRGLV